MNKSIQMVILSSLVPALFIAKSANANESTERWTSFYRDDSQQRFADLTTVKRKNNIVRMWELTNFNNPEDGVASDIGLHEYDCNGQRWRAIALRTYSKSDGQGAVLVSSDTPNAEWRYVVPRSIGESTLQFFCKVVKNSR